MANGAGPESVSACARCGSRLSRYNAKNVCTACGKARAHDGTRSQPIAYNEWSLYQDFEQAQRDGTLSAFFLGIGLDALTLAATILTVVVIDDDVFDRTLGSPVHFNDEGEVVSVKGGSAAEGVPFTEEAVERMLSAEPMASPGAACLALA